MCRCRRTWGLTNVQIGLGLSVYAVVQTLAYFAAPYLADRFPRRHPFGSRAHGRGTVRPVPGYDAFVYRVSGGVRHAGAFWRSHFLARDVEGCQFDRQRGKQGRLFGFLEAGRGLVDVAVASSALGIFMLCGGGRQGLQAGILFYACVALATGIVTFFGRITRTRRRRG